MNPTPHRQRVVIFPTPNVDDLLFYELVDNHRVGEKNVPDYGTAHPDTTKWPNHRLIHIKAHDDQGKMWRYYYAADQLEQDDDNWSHSQADIGGTRFDAVSRDYLVRRSEYNPESPAQGATMPDVPASKFTGTYVLAERSQIQINDEVLAGLYVVDRRSYVEKTQLVGIRVSEADNQAQRSTLDYYYRGETVTDSSTVEDLFDDPDDPYWDAYYEQVDGTIYAYKRREGKQVTSNWFTIETTTLVTGERDGTVITLQDYYTSQNYTWPPVFGGWRELEWEKRAGGEWSVTDVWFDKDRYSGPCKARVQIDWSPDEFGTETGPNADLVQPDEPPLPKPIVIQTPYFSVSVPPCLHGRIPEGEPQGIVANPTNPNNAIQISSGTTDPVFEYTTIEYIFPATNYEGWVGLEEDGLKVTDIQEPSKGGWLRRRVWVYPPTTLDPAEYDDTAEGPSDPYA